jgi:hypothetical protein
VVRTDKKAKKWSKMIGRRGGWRCSSGDGNWWAGGEDRGPFEWPRLSSRSDPADHIDELGHVGDPALEQVARALPASQQLHRVFDFDMPAANLELEEDDLAEIAAAVRATGAGSGPASPPLVAPPLQ